MIIICEDEILVKIAKFLYMNLVCDLLITWTRFYWIKCVFIIILMSIAIVWVNVKVLNYCMSE
jgi:hypothetical protein